MRKELISAIALVTIIFVVGCKQDLPTVFNETDGIYFNSPSDSFSYTFAKYPNRNVDTIKLPVMILGNTSANDREIAVDVVSGSGLTAKEGVHFKLLSPYKMPANKVLTELPVVVYRTSDLDSISAAFQLQLKPNNNFSSGITSKTSLKVKLGYLQKPATWGEIGGIQWAGFSGNFGTWTKTKYKLILDALYDPVGDSTITEFPYARLNAPSAYVQYLQMVKNYIRTKYPGNYSGTGATLRDPDANNALVLVGPANY